MIAKTNSRAPEFPIVLTILMVASSWGAQTYSVTDLGPLIDLAGRTDSKPYAINALGVVAGGNVTGGSYQALVFTNSWKDLGTLGGNESLAAAINDSGRVVGYSFTGTGATNAFLWTPGAIDGVSGNPQMKSLGTLGGGASQAYGINNSGQVTGYSDTSARPPLQHAFLYTAGTMQDIGQALNALPNSYGYSVNTSGHVAGTAYDANYTAPHAFFYNGSTSSDLGVFGGQGSSALAINNQDTIVGYLTTSSSFDHAFVYSGGTPTDLGTLGGNYSYALAVNNNNLIVGGSFVDAKDSVYHAFIWSNGVMTDLNGQLGASGTGWTLNEARAINDAGQITGIGSVGGISHAFLLSPASAPPPGQAPQITAIQTIGPDVIVHFTTGASGTYTVQMNGALGGSGWTDLSPSLPGTGGILSVTHSGGASFPTRFYRVRASVP
jgi:probable HAF family extracellular repeat protein